MSDKKTKTERHTNRTFLIGLARAFAGAVLFSFPVIMTMEMWSLGFSITPFRLALFITLAIPLLFGLSYFVGFEDTSSLTDDIIDAFVAFAVGFITAAVLLYLFNIVNFTMSVEEFVGKISIQAVIAAIGALLAQSQLGMNRGQDNDEQSNSAGQDENNGDNQPQRRGTSYFGELFLMIVGALFLAMNPAPTEEISLISFKMSDWEIVALALGTIILMHAFVYRLEFRGQEKPRPAKSSILSIFMRYTIVGYALVLIVSLYLAWTFGQIEGLGAANAARLIVVMGFPAAIGAAAARLIL